jgi:hypothetical protein
MLEIIWINNSHVYTSKNHVLSAYVVCSYELASVLSVKPEINILWIIV